MLTVEGITEVSYTAEPAVLGDWTLTIFDIIKVTTAADWDGWIRLTPAGAAKVLKIINSTRPVKRKARRAISSQPTPEIIDGEVVAESTVA